MHGGMLNNLRQWLVTLHSAAHWVGTENQGNNSDYCPHNPIDLHFSTLFSPCTID